MFKSVALEVAAPELSPIVGMLARRVGRTVFGAILIVGACVLVHAAAGEREFGAAAILAKTWGAAFAGGALAWALARLTAHAWRTDVCARAGLVLPAIGVALVTPLTLHMLVALVAGSGGDGFDEWVRISLVCTGAAHGVLALVSAMRASAAASDLPVLRVRHVFLIVVGVTCVPFIFLVLPPILVGITGLAMMPLLQAPERIAARERAILVTTPALARARVTR